MAAAGAAVPLPAGDGAAAPPPPPSHATPAVRAASEAEKKLYGELDALEADIAAIEEDYISTYAAGNIAGGYEGARVCLFRREFRRSQPPHTTNHNAAPRRAAARRLRRHCGCVSSARRTAPVFIVFDVLA